MEGDGFPDRYKIIDLRLTDRLVGVALFVGDLLLNRHKKEPQRLPEHAHVPLDDEWFKQDIAVDVENQLRIPYDSEGSWHQYDS